MKNKIKNDNKPEKNSKANSSEKKNEKKVKVSSFPSISILKSDLAFKVKVQLIWRRCKGSLFKIPIYFMLIAMSFVFLLPFAYMILRSMMSNTDLLNATMVKWLPRTIDFKNYSYAIISLDYWNKLFTSVWTTGIAVVAQLISCTFVAYGLARINFKGRGFIFGLVIFTLIIPPQVTIAPTYIMFSPNGIVNWLDTFLPIIVPCFFGMGLSGGLFIFIYRQYFKGMPAELENAALIDGCGIFGSYFRIILPNAKSPMLVSVILSMVWQWNNYFEPSIFITDVVNKGNLPMQLNVMSQNLGVLGNKMNSATEMAATFLVVLPIILVFFLVQNQFMKGIERVGLAN